jgi:Flp pilus assembly protein TadG
MRRILSFCGDVWHDRSGVVALEFAMVAPVLLVFIMGTVEISNAIRLQAKLNVAVGQLAELVAGQSSVTAPAGTLADVCTGAAMNIAPYPVSALSADIVSISNDHPSNRIPLSTDAITVNTYLDWESISSCVASAPSALGLAGAFILANTPNSLLTKSGVSASGISDLSLKHGYSVIVVTAQYSYKNVLTFFLGKTINFSAVAVARPRANATIRCTTVDGSMSCPATS